MWDSNNGTILVSYNYETRKDNILCINLSKDNKRLVASATIGLVLVSILYTIITLLVFCV